MKDKISIQVNECKETFNVEVTKRNAEVDLRGWEEERGCAPFLFFAISCFLQSIWRIRNCVEIEAIINNAPLTYVYPNTNETCLTLNHLLIAKQLLYSSNTTSTVATNPTVLSSTTDKINRISNHFWDRWRYEYVVNLRETQRTSKLNIKM